jgi:hypothetical protein
MKLDFSRHILETYSIRNFLKIRPLVAELLHVGGLTDGRSNRHDEVDRRFSRICEKRLKTSQSEGDKQSVQVTASLSTSLKPLSLRKHQLAQTSARPHSIPFVTDKLSILSLRLIRIVRTKTIYYK